jgi:hypothetical protein
MRYDEYTLNAIAEWFAANGYPRDIPYLNFEYHIRYRSEILFADDEYDSEWSDADENTGTPKTSLTSCA